MDFEREITRVLNGVGCNFFDYFIISSQIINDLCPETSYQRPVKTKTFAEKQEGNRKLLRSATGKRREDRKQLLDEEDKFDEREMLRAQNRIKRRDYEDLINEGTSPLLMRYLQFFIKLVQISSCLYRRWRIS